MHSLKLYGLENWLETTGLMLRLILHHKEVFRLPAAGRGIEVVAGTAWVTVNGRDIFLTSGERLWLPTRRDAVLISALGRAPVILEVFETSSQADFIKDCMGWQIRSPPDAAPGIIQIQRGYP